MGSKAPYYELEIRVRQTLSADGTTSSYSTVYCPTQMRTVRVKECVDCEEYIGLSFDREERSGLLHCYKSSAPTPRQSLRRFLQAGEREGFVRKLHQRADSTPVSRIMSLNVQCVFGGIPVGKQARALVGGFDAWVAAGGAVATGATEPAPGEAEDGAPEEPGEPESDPGS